MNKGFIYVPEDERDYPVCMAYEDADNIEIPENFTTSFQPPFAKQISSNCVAQTIANIMEVMYYNIMGRHEDFSVGFVYGNRDKGEFSGEGMYGYKACGHLCEDGNVKSALFDNPCSAPSIIEAVNEFKASYPNWKDEAYIPKFYVRTKNVDEVKKFIYKYNIPVMGIVESKHIGQILGGNYSHAMALYGWKGDKAIFQNSWGEDNKYRTPEIEFKKCTEFWLIMPFKIAEFVDLNSEHWAYHEILKCVEDELLLGYPDSTFKPDKDITRAELCVIIYRLLKSGKADTLINSI